MSLTPTRAVELGDHACKDLLTKSLAVREQPARHRDREIDTVSDGFPTLLKTLRVLSAAVGQCRLCQETPHPYSRQRLHGCKVLKNAEAVRCISVPELLLWQQPIDC
jgi:hypothetical protein